MPVIQFIVKVEEYIENKNADFFLKQIAKMAQTPGDCLLGRVLSLSVKV